MRAGGVRPAGGTRHSRPDRPGGAARGPRRAAGGPARAGRGPGQAGAPAGRVQARRCGPHLGPVRRRLRGGPARCRPQPLCPAARAQGLARAGRARAADLGAGRRPAERLAVGLAAGIRRPGSTSRRRRRARPSQAVDGHCTRPGPAEPGPDRILGRRGRSDPGRALRRRRRAELRLRARARLAPGALGVRGGQRGPEPPAARRGGAQRRAAVGARPSRGEGPR